MDNKVQTSRHWHATFDSGEQIVADYYPDENRLETYYLPKPNAEWQPATHTSVYGISDNLKTIRKWAPHFKDLPHNTILCYNPNTDEMEVMLWMQTKNKSALIKAKEIEPTEELPGL
jgi:hypothetical protein